MEKIAFDIEQWTKAVELSSCRLQSTKTFEYWEVELSSRAFHLLLSAISKNIASTSTDRISYIGSAWIWLNARFIALKFLPEVFFLLCFLSVFFFVDELIYKARVIARASFVSERE